MERNLKEKSVKTIGSVTKAIEVIEHIANTKKELGVTEISNELNYGISGMYHLLNTLKQSDIVVQDQETKKYKLSLKIWKIGMLVYGNNQLLDILGPYLVKLRDMTGETANLTILDNENIVYIAQEESDKLVRMFTKTGAEAPLHCTSAGKIFMAHMKENERNNIFDSIKFEKYTDNTLVKKEDLIREIKQIRKTGYALDNEEREIGVSCIGAPIFDIHNEVLACITISGPTARFSEENKKKWIKIILDISNKANNYLETIDNSI